MKTFIIHYGVYCTGGKYESGKYKVRNCMSDLHAKTKLEDYLKRKYPDFQRMVIYECEEDIFSFFPFWQ